MDNTTFKERLDLTPLRDTFEKLNTEVTKVIKGQEEMIKLIYISILSDGHILIEGVPGIAKTLTAKLITKTISADFSRIQFTPDLMLQNLNSNSIKVQYFQILSLLMKLTVPRQKLNQHFLRLWRKNRLRLTGQPISWRNLF